MIPNFAAGNYDIFTIALCSVIGRTIGMNGIPIGYVLRGVTGNYDFPWANREDKLNNCLLNTGDSFNNDNVTLYSLYSQYISTKGAGSNIIKKYHSTKNGCKCHQYF